MSLSRRALFPAAAGGILAAPEAAKAAMQQAEQGFGHPGMPPSTYYGGAEDDAKCISQKLGAYRQELLDQKARLERWARGDFQDDELDDHRNIDPRSPPYDHRGHEIAELKSVSKGHKMRMMEELGQRRYIEHRKLEAGRSLQRIIKQLVGL